MLLRTYQPRSNRSGTHNRLQKQDICRNQSKGLATLLESLPQRVTGVCSGVTPPHFTNVHIGKTYPESIFFDPEQVSVNEVFSTTKSIRRSLNDKYQVLSQEESHHYTRMMRSVHIFARLNATSNSKWGMTILSCAISGIGISLLMQRTMMFSVGISACLGLASKLASIYFNKLQQHIYLERAYRHSLALAHLCSFNEDKQPILINDKQGLKHLFDL